MENTPNEYDPNTNPQLTEKLFIRSEYVFHMESTNKKIDKIITTALKKIPKHTNHTLTKLIISH